MYIEMSDIESHLTYKATLKLIKEVREKHNKLYERLKQIHIEHKFEPDISIGLWDLLYSKYSKYKDITRILYVVFVSLIKVRLMKQENWKTTVGGVVFAIGTVLSTMHNPDWMPLVGQVLMAAAAIFFGYNAADK